MELNANTKIDDLLKEHPHLMDFLISLSDKFKALQNPIMRNTVAKIATITQVAAIGGMEVDQLLQELAGAIQSKKSGFHAPSPKPAASAAIEVLTDNAARQEVLKEIIRDLHKGVDMAVLKKRFHDLIKDIDPSEIAKMEQRLMDEGMPESEIKKLCDVHVEVFKESLSAQEAPDVPLGHPVHTMMMENRAAEGLLHELDHLLAAIGDAPDRELFTQHQKTLASLIDRLSEINLHYQRKENQLFPILEAHSITGPSQVMWALHDDIRQAFKIARTGIAKPEVPGVIATIKYLVKSVRDMIYKEEHILFPMAIDQLQQEEWQKVGKGEDEIGFAWVAPDQEWIPGSEAVPAAPQVRGNNNGLKLDTGQMTLQQVNLMLKHLPLDISFVNEKDEVLYYSSTPERLFPRSPGVIGRKVQNCHPPKSFAMVQKILDEFRAGRKNDADFWIQMKSKLILIRYFAVRDEDGVYRGCLEVSQDVTDIKKIEGQKRLLDWK